jgi:hypothetical protein
MEERTFFFGGLLTILPCGPFDSPWEYACSSDHPMLYIFTDEELDKFLYFCISFRRVAFDTGHDLTLERILTASARSAQQIRDNLRVQVGNGRTPLRMRSE